jgi:alkanesulfonate monooxygenase SsuD/methylene tetrahydromethanopterin reductase-like flavin-dependent oxidoreductase (luciferase family)
VRAGLTLPIFDELADPRLLGELAAEAEAEGWDGVFVWDHVTYRAPARSATDPWTAMACIAMATSSVLFGPMVTPIARRRPHVLARQVAALDQLSGGRFVLGAGLGLDSSGGELSKFGEELDDRVRAQMLDEGLALLGDLLAGGRVDHRGSHFTAIDVQFEPAAVDGRVPVWVAGRWPNRRPLQRAARHDGLFLIDVPAPTDLSAVAEIIRESRVDGLEGFDLVVQLTDGQSPQPWEAAGATWWLACFDPFTVTAAEVRQRIKRGPQG